MRNLINRKNRGFTLIELLVVIAIIGILAAVVLVSLNSARLKSRDARRLADVRQVMTALELYYNDNGGYPAAAANHPDPAAGATGAKFSSYLAAYPVYPTPANDGGCAATDYVYTQTGSGSGYTITFCLGGTSGGFSQGNHTASPAGLQ
jgi:prepilin-type N-terminal cleavage/methylation domain-containing protein